MSNFRDGTLEQGQAMPAVSQTVLLTADNQAIDPGNATLILLGSDSATATSRTFTLAASTFGPGHDLVIIFTTGSSKTCQLQDTGIQKLVGDWLPTQYDAIHLKFDGTNWVEVARGQSAENLPSIPLASAHILVGASSGLAADVAMSGDVTIGNTGVTAIGASKVLTTMVADANVTLAKLASGITPSHRMFAAGQIAMSGTSQDITVASAAATDIPFAQINTADSNNRTILTCVAATGKITVTFSGAAGTGGNVSYQVLRAAT